MDNRLIDKVNHESYSVCPLVKGLSVHDAQIITTNNVTVDKRIDKSQSLRKFNNFCISKFAIILIYENCGQCFYRGGC